MAPPSIQFALFSTTTSISTNIIDKILISAQNRAKSAYVAGSYFKYVPTHTALLDATSSNDSTQPPVQETTDPDFVHHTYDQLASALRDAPDSMALNRKFFAIMDERTNRDKSLVICKYIDGDAERKTGVYWLRCRPNIASLYLAGQATASGSWDELESSVEMQRRQGGDEDDVLDEDFRWK